MEASDSSSDGLSEFESAQLFIISFPCPTWLDVLKDSYGSDSEYQQLFSALTGPDPSVPHFSLQNGIFLYKDKVFLSADSPLKPLVLQHAHNIPVGGHSRYLKTMHRVQQDFFWFAMKKDIKEHIRTCEICQGIKVDTIKPVGLLQPLPIPDKPWMDISMDFITGLPKSHGFDVIMVVVDRLTKFVHFMPLSHPYTTAKVA